MNLFNVDTLSWIYAIGLLILGFVLILLEIFVIPGFNIFGIIGVVTVFTGVGYAYLTLGTGAAVLVAVLGMVGTFALIRLLIRNRAWQRLVLTSQVTRELGYDAAPQGLEELVGQSGEALTPLRPSGRAQFGDRAIDVVTEGGFVVRGRPIEVLSVLGNRVVVQERVRID